MSKNSSVAADTAPSTSTNIVALPHRPEAVGPGEKALSFVKEHPVLTVAGGIAVGLVVSALLPRSFSRKFAKRAFKLAEAGATAALAFGQDTLDKAEDQSVVARKKANVLAGQAERLGEKAVAKAEKLGIAALGSASVLGHVAADRAERLGHAAASRAEGLGERASERLSEYSSKALAQSSKLFGYPKAPASVTDRIVGKALELKARLHH
jgi:hypothetical protein